MVVDDEQNKLNYSEKREIFRKYTKVDDLSEETFDKILKNETYFPLLCNTFAINRDQFQDVLQFFTEPIDVFKNEIESYKEFDKVKYCGLVCLVLFNNKLSQNDLIVSKELFRKCLDLCDVRVSLPPAIVIRNLELLEGLFVTKVVITISFITTL